MTVRPELWTLEELNGPRAGRAVVWSTPSAAETVSATIRYPIVSPTAMIGEDIETLIVVGGGSLIDEAKCLVAERGRSLRLVAIPSIWGSGAEASPFAVRNRGDEKEILAGDRFVPSVVVDYPELASRLTESRAREACGDAWAHAVEALLSPLSGTEGRTECGSLIRDMLELPLAFDPRWFDASRRACAAQARSGVGLIHGIAHTIESPLRRALGNAWGHARLCSLYLWPALELNLEASPIAKATIALAGLDLAAIVHVTTCLFDSRLYRETLETLEMSWPRVLRDRCTRMNCTVVRKDTLNHFLRFA